MKILFLILGLLCFNCNGLEDEVALEPSGNFFWNLFDEHTKIDPDIIKQLLTATTGKKLYIDSDEDGYIDVLYMIDTSARHTADKQPLFVKIIDEDGDMRETGEGDKDSDLYIADWNANGIIDRVVDYHNLDGDGDVDEQYFFGINEKGAYVTWAKDYGDDNNLLYDVNYEYNQNLSQWKSDFNGDEMFVFNFIYQNSHLTPDFEIAFSFYDADVDGYSEEAIRFSGSGSRINDMRYSMDIDNDNANQTPLFHDYDFSVSCIGLVNIPAENSHSVRIREAETEMIVKWEDMKFIAKNGSWNKIHLTWDENDNNIDPWLGSSNNERWEGVISHESEYMPGIGAPSGGRYNKRNEIDLDASGKMHFYFSPHDQRLHLFGAEVGWLEVDYNYDDEIDMIMHMRDTDNDGFFDQWQYDLNGNGSFEKEINFFDHTYEKYPLNFNVLHKIYKLHLETMIALNDKLIGRMKEILKKEENIFSTDPLEQYFYSELINYGAADNLGLKIKKSREGQRYYKDLIRERYWYRLTQSKVSEKENFSSIQEKYDEGNFEKVYYLLLSL